MNICFITYDFSLINGGPKSLANIANVLAAKGYGISIISIYAASPVWPIETEKHIKVNYLIKGEGRFLRDFSRILKRLNKLIKNQPYDVIVANGYSSDLLAFFSSKLIKKPFIHWEHTSLANTYYASDLISHFYRWIGAHKSKYIVALTEKGKQSFLDKYRISREKIAVIPGWANMAGCIEKSNVESKTIITVSRGDPVKGLDRLVKVARYIKDKLPGWKWEVWGDFENECGREFRSDLQKYGLDSFVLLMGKTSNIFNSYINSSLSVMTSYFEGMPLVLIESLSCGVPCIAFDIPEGPSEVIKDKENGRLIKDGDIEGMANAILELAGDFELRKQYASKSGVLLNNFSKDVVVQKWEYLLNRTNE